MGNLTVCQMIKKRRLELGLSQAELAKRMNLTSRSTICRVESGTEDNLTSDRVAKFAKALDCTPGYLMGWESNLTDENADAIVNMLKYAEDSLLLRKIESLTGDEKKEVHRFVDFLISKKAADNSD